MNKDNFVVSTYGVRSPRIIYGTAWKQSKTEELVSKAVGFGFRGIDTACQPKHYFEPGVGAAIAGCGLKRAEVYLQTKFTPLPDHDPGRIPYDPKAGQAERVAQSFRTSLSNLQTSYVDCLVLHSPLEREQDANEVWQAMEAIFDSGGARQLGVSHCYDITLLEKHYRLARIKPAVVQNRFYAETGYDREVRAFCRQHGIIYQSFWTLKANPHILAHPALQSAATAHGRKPEQILFRYLTQQGVVPLTGTTSEVHMKESLEIFDFELSERECEALSALCVRAAG